MNIPQLTGRQIKYIRSMLDLSQAELAAKAGISQPTIYRMELDPAKVHESIAVMKIRALADPSLGCKLSLRQVEHRADIFDLAAGELRYVHDINLDL